jgi:hypothetical protein
MGGLRIVAVNHRHPEVAHVGALRVRCFADALARRGHQMVLVTESLRPEDPAPAPEAWAWALSEHDWREPLLLPCPPRRRSPVSRARSGEWPAPLNKALLASGYVVRGGVFGDWVAGTRPYWRLLARAFRPQVTWGSFGNTGAWLIARGIARAARCPWVADLKDSWRYFIPEGLRGGVARRFRDAAAMTALSRYYAEEAKRWFGRDPVVIYSGVDARLVRECVDAPPDPNRLTLVGSVYGHDSLDSLMCGIASWAEGRAGKGGDKLRLEYFGADGAAVEAASHLLKGVCRVEIRGFRPLPEMYAALRGSRLNAYIRDGRGPFHHKLFELLSVDRPILCLPPEGAEARAIVAHTGGRLYGCREPEEVQAALDAVWRGPIEPAGVDRDRILDFSWDAQAGRLEEVLATASGTVGG